MDAAEELHIDGGGGGTLTLGNLHSFARRNREGSPGLPLGGQFPSH
jgi:hypothetical protein